MPRGVPKSGQRKRKTPSAQAPKAQALTISQLGAPPAAVDRGRSHPHMSFHIDATTAEELRVELVAYLDYRKAREQSRSAGASTVRESKEYAARIQLLAELTEFWRAIQIHKGQ